MPSAPILAPRGPRHRRHVGVVLVLALAALSLTECIAHTCGDECRRAFDACVEHPPHGGAAECAAADQSCNARCTD
ncbi:MAG: hypothetical protein U0235_07675 [Polyangiaceae bacterium]